MIGYNPQSKFAADFKTKRWDQVLQEPGIRIGRTDPKLDPKGAFTVEMMTKAAELYHQPDLVEKTLGDAENPAQVLPEETLVGRLQSGQLDAGFFYSTETSDLKIPALQPGARIAGQGQLHADDSRATHRTCGREPLRRLPAERKGRALLQAAWRGRDQAHRHRQRPSDAAFSTGRDRRRTVTV